MNLPFVSSLAPAGPLRAARCARAAFTLVETLVAMVIVGIVAAALYSGMAHAMMTMQLARENARATQILTEKMDIIRLYNWQRVNPSYIPTNFTDLFDPVAAAKNSKAGGPAYGGSITIAPVPLSVGYAPRMRQVTVEVHWQTRGPRRSRQLTTYVSRYGLHNYIQN